MLTHAELKAKALQSPSVRAEYERLNREEFAILDEMLAARRAAGLSQPNSDKLPATSSKAPERGTHPIKTEERVIFWLNPRHFQAERFSHAAGAVG